ncbi:hypothetical protein FSP39_004034 [Pinctada imbricata]|uniref:Cytochrome P450 n=1 Tax=Pinctada imbricata TaxID=66713 RepID=A0AA88XJE0_PINIB|nr:hypothetical protein FSP39_004034 [Pinctada imbricata]
MITSALVLCVTVLCFKTYRRRQGLPPGPLCLPFVGTLLSAGLSQHPTDIAKLRKKYGDVYTLMFGSKVIIMVTGSEAMREIIIKHADSVTDRPPVSQMLQLNNGCGIIATSGELWKQQRSFALKTLRSFGFGKRCLEHQILQEVEIFMGEITKRGGEPFYAKEVLSPAFANIICSIVFGKRFEYNDERLNIVLRVINLDFAKINIVLRMIGMTLPWLRHLPGDITGFKQRMRYETEIKFFINSEIQRHKDSFDENEIRDYIDAFMLEQIREKNNANSTFSDQQLLASVRDLFIAGSETTATTISWALLYLMANPSVQNRMRKEIDDVIGKTGKPSLEHKSKLPYCEVVITEVQRLGNIAPFAVPHHVSDDVIWRDFLIPKGASLMLNLDSVLMDPITFPSPEKFDPERFLNEEGKCVGQNSFIPFGLGRRVCLGESLARMELFLFIISLVQNFEILKENDQSELSFEEIRGGTRSPVPFKVRFKPRN